MKEPRNQIMSLLKSGHPHEIVLRERHTLDETRALEEIGRFIGEFLKD